MARNVNGVKTIILRSLEFFDYVANNLMHLFPSKQHYGPHNVENEKNVNKLFSLKTCSKAAFNQRSQEDYHETLKVKRHSQ